jgi:hypothetical protein
MIMQTLSDFLAFRYFIAADILILCYYIGAILFPLALYLSHTYLLHKIPWLNQVYTEIMTRIGTLSSQKKLLGIIFFIVILGMMEIVWRMMFEMMIGYFQMHDYLQALSTAK